MKLHFVVEHKDRKWKFRIHHYTYAFPIWIVAILQLWLWLIPVGFIMFISDVRDFHNDMRDKIYRRISGYMKRRNNKHAEIPAKS